MMAAIKAATASIGDSDFFDWCGKAGDVIDCVIPIALTGVILASFGWIAFISFH